MARSASLADQERLPERQFRNQLAAAARSINWSYALFWSISSTHPGVLTWTDGFYNGEVRTRKVSNSAELTADQLIMQRSQLLRELYEALPSGEYDRRASRPAIGSLSPEDLGDTEWYYVVCMTYAFRPGQGLPGRSFASNQHVWLCNAHLAGSKAFPRALLAKSASIQTIVCIPLMGGVLELGTTDTVLEDPDLVSRASAAFREPHSQCPTYSQEPPSSPPSANETGEAADIIVLEDALDHNDMEAMIAAGAKELGEAEGLSNARRLAHISKEMDEFCSLLEEFDVQALEDSLVMDDGSLQVRSSPPPATASTPVGGCGSRATSFRAWTRSASNSDQAAAIKEPQKLLKKVVAGGAAWANPGSARTTQEKNHVKSERKRREKLNEMFLMLKSLVPSIHKMDKASILAETIAYLKELQRRVQEMESSRELISRPSEITRPPTTRPHGSERVVRKKACAGIKRKASELGGDVEKERPRVLPNDSGITSNVTVTVSDKDVLLEAQCRWEELLMTRVFDAIKKLHLDVLSVHASAPDGFMGLKIRAQFAGSGAVVPWMISEALRKAIGSQ